MRRLGIILTGLLALLALPAAAVAANGGQNSVLAKGDNRTGTYYASGQTVTVNGDVDGDVVCAGQTVVINGSVKGDVICAGQTVTVNGPVTGSVRAAGQVVTVNEAVERNVTVMAQDFVLGPDSKVAGEVSAAGDTVLVGGEAAKNVTAGARELTLDAVIGGSVWAYVESLQLGKSAKLSGNLDYSSDQTFALDKDKVTGTVTRHSPAHVAATQPTVADRLSMLLFWMASGLAGILLTIWLAPRFVRGATNAMVRRWQASLGWGALALLVVPLLLFLLALTVVGLPVAVIVGVLWLIIVLTSGLLAGVAIGRIALKNEQDDQKGLAMAALVGVPFVLLASWVPFLGVVVTVLVAAWTVGGILLAGNRARLLG